MPHYNALIFRKRRKDLTDLIKKSKDIYPLVDRGAVFHKQDSYWEFSSGATIYFQYFDRFDVAETFMQGQEFQMIVMEEAGQYETADIFSYAMSRLRSSNSLRVYMRATCNPSRYPWLREFFRIDDSGTPTDFYNEYTLSNGSKVKKRIKFIRARLSDNPYLPDYEAQLLMMGDQDVNALLHGMWNAYDSEDGVVYAPELQKANKEGRIGNLPYDPAYPVYTAWDLGIGDSGCILFAQFVGKEVRVIKKLAGKNNTIRDYYVPQIKLLEARENWIFAKHYIPHDGAKRSQFTGDTIFDQTSQILPNCVKLSIGSIEGGIQQTKAMFKNLWIDKGTELQDDLAKYKYKYNSKTSTWGAPEHDDIGSADCLRYLSYIKPVNLTANDITPGKSASPFTFTR